MLINKYSKQQENQLTNSDLFSIYTCIAHENSNLVVIKELDLSRAGELETDQNGFRDFTSLSKLILTKTKISTINSNWFDTYNNLQHLDASRNEIKIIRRESLRQLVELTHLNLSYNEISNIQPKSFADLTKLETLTLRYNALNAFVGIGLPDSLKQLDLSENSLTSVRTLKLFAIRPLR